jgi:hypothetical protein
VARLAWRVEIAAGVLKRVRVMASEELVAIRDRRACGAWWLRQRLLFGRKGLEFLTAAGYELVSCGQPGGHQVLEARCWKWQRQSFG